MSRSSSLPPVAVDALVSVHQHRALTARQLQVLHAPTSTLRWMQKVTARLAAHGLLDSVRVDRGRQLFFVTAAGADAVGLVGSRAETRRLVMRPEQAAGPLRRHTHAVNDVGIAFVAAARERGDACGPWSWRHEIAHPIGHLPGQQRSEQLISDALLTYEHHADEQLSFHYRLIELDRATMAVDDLAAKLSRYVRLYRHTVTASDRDDPVPAWTYRYSVFPRVLVVLTNSTSAALARRRGTLLALCREDQDLCEGRSVHVDVCLLDELRTAGPFAPIFRSVEDPDTPVTWLGAR